MSREGAAGRPREGRVLTIRLLTPSDDLDAFGRIVLDAYLALPGHPREAEYEDELLDVAGRLATNPVFGAFDGDEPVGCVTFVPDATSAHAEDLEDDEAAFRMLAVARNAQGRGVGEALVRACLDLARDDGKRAVFIYSGDWMTTAHRLYERLGFVRVPQRDWRLDDPPILLLGLARALG
jgi:ribosomal protein S18 acetylase RimI-like enzyme